MATTEDLKNKIYETVARFLVEDVCLSDKDHSKYSNEIKKAVKQVFNRMKQIEKSIESEEGYSCVDYEHKYMCESHEDFYREEK